MNQVFLKGQAEAKQAVLPRLNNLQILRAVAAGFVVLYHSQHYLQYFVGPSAIANAFNGQWGFYGVAIFFAISGFLMADLIHKSDAWTFILHRAVRIYPPYYVAAALSIAALYFMPWQPQIDKLGLTLVPGFAPGALGIEWTLVAETTFYVVLFIVSIFGGAKWLTWIATIWLSAILATTWFAPALQTPISPPLETILLSSMNIPFAAGLLLPRLMKMATLWPFVLLMGLPLTIVTMYSDINTMRWAGGLSCVLLVGATAQLPQIQGTNWLSRVAIKFGDWSYATYLVHCTVCWLLFQAFAGYQHPTRIWLLSLLLIAFASWLFGTLDVAAYRVFRRRVNTSTKKTKVAWGSVYLAIFISACVIGVVM